MRASTVAVHILTALSMAGPSALAAASADVAPRPARSSDAAEPLIAINTVCPVDGERIDPEIPPIRARTVTGRIVGIGVCSRACAELVRKDPDRFLEDAIANHRHRASADERR